MQYNAAKWQVIGHEWAIEQLTLAMNRGRSRHAYLLSGPPSIGKTTLARAVAMTLNCTAEGDRPCGECRPCTLIAKDSHPDIAYLEADRVGGTLKIDQIRELQRSLALRPYEAKHRVAIIQRFQEAHPAAANALLKTLEEPPGKAVIILTTDNLHSTLPTILSRCQHFPLRPLPFEQVQDVLEVNWQMETERARLLAHLSGGRIGWALNAVEDEKAYEWRDDYIELLETILTLSRRERFKVGDDIRKDKSQLLEILQLWQTYWRDALLVSEGVTEWVTNIDRHKVLTALAEQFPSDVHRRALEATRRTMQYLRRNVNTQLAVETMLLDYPFMSPVEG